MARKTKRVICLAISLVLCSCNFLVSKAEALPEIMSGSTTLADNIMSYYALSGSAVANTDWINTLYNSYGSSFGTVEELANQGYLVLNDAGVWESTQALGEMIEQAPAYTSLGLNQIFNVSAEEALQGGGFAAASGGSILAGSLGGVASTGTLPLFGGVTAAYWGGIALGTLIAHKIGLYGREIFDGVPITSNKVLQSLPAGTSPVYSGISGSNYKYLWYSDNAYMLWLNLKYSNKLVLLALHPSSDRLRYYRQQGDSGTISSGTSGNVIISGNIGTASFSYDVRPNPVPITYNFSSADDYDEFIAKVKNGTIVPKKKSNDMIGENGNLSGEQTQQGEYTVPDMKPQIDPGTQAGKPLSLQDWLNFANAVQNNNNQTAPSGTPDNQALFDSILDLIKSATNQNPDPNPEPWSPPVATPVPDPSYPDPVPDQQITENPQESENPQQTENPIDTGKPWRLPDLRQKFPFCIPWDIAKIFTKLKVNVRQAPHISWRFNPPNTPIDYTFNLDLEDFEEVAALLRTLELMGFIVGLAFVTRYLIGAN